MHRLLLPGTSDIPGGSDPPTSDAVYGGVPPNGVTTAAVRLATVVSAKPVNPLCSAVLGLVINTAKIFDTATPSGRSRSR